MTAVRMSWLGVALLAAAAFPAFAEEAGALTETKTEKPNFPYKTVQTPEGLIFRVPSDMPIETRGGIQAPIPFDEYVYGKFGAVDSRLSVLSERVAKMEEKLQAIETSKGASAGEAASGAGGTDGGILKAGAA